MGLPLFDRADALRRLAAEELDVLVVGGGITGAGCALDAASRGLRTGLVERDDFASGTSSKSSKLVHGGIRYLQQREIALVYENLRERQRALENAPHLVRVLPFLIPVLSRDGLINRRVARALGLAMWLYDFTGGMRIRKLHRRIDREEALRHMPTLRRDNVAAAYVYYDARADDARLTLCIARTAAAHGALVANDTRVTGFLKDEQGRIRGATVEADGATIEIRARAVVNATGVWSDDVRALDEGAHPDSLRPAKGVHITVPWDKVRNDIAAIIPVPKDKRSVFVVPWGDFTYVGTTDTEYEGPLDDPKCTAEDVGYLLRALNFAIEDTVGPEDVLATWAGLRPLLRGAKSERTADLSRRHGVRVADSGLVTITGGKLTTYRQMAADTVDVVARRLKIRRRRCRTKKLRLVGAEGFETPDAGVGGFADRRRRSRSGAQATDGAGLEPSLHEHLASRYGTEADVVLDLIEADPSLGEALVPGLPYVRAEAVHAVRHEMARSVDDVLSRRTRARLLARDATAAAADDVARLIGPELGWDDAEISRQRDDFRSALAHERAAAGLPETALDATLGA